MIHAFRKRRGTEGAGLRMGESHHKSDRKGHPRDERGGSRGVDPIRRDRERPDGSERYFSTLTTTENAFVPLSDTMGSQVS